MLTVTVDPPATPSEPYVALGVDGDGRPAILVIRDVRSRLVAQITAARHGFRFCVVYSQSELAEILSEMKQSPS